MKNKEKYPKTEDAVKAYEEHKKRCKCDCTFDEWLDVDMDAAKEEIASKLAGLVTGAIFAPLLLGGMLKGGDKAGDKLKENPDVGDLGKCPVCGGAVKLETTIVDTIDCPDCGMHFGMNKGDSDKDHRERLLANWRKLQENVKK